LQGTRQALYDKDRESITITVPRVNERIVGALIALYERAVSFYASLVNINAYHQPGVEAGKKAAANILALQKRLVSALQDAGEPLLISELATQVGAIEQVETVYWILRHLAANGRGPVLVGNPGQPASLKVSWK
jgi:glucose-6-phosphate isomerase